MAQRYEIVPYRRDLKAQILKLQTHLWSPSLALNAAYFEWKYERNPYRKDPLIFVAMHDGNVVGMRGFFGVRWEGGTPIQRFTSLYADDMVIAPEHRKRGIVTQLMTSAFEYLADQAYDYVFNLSAGDITLLSSLSMGWRSAGWAHPMRCRSLRATLESGVLRRLNGAPLLSLGLSRLTRSPHSLEALDLKRANGLLRRTPLIAVEDTARCAAMADLVDRLGSSGRIRHVRDAEYFDWRFQNPLSRYRFLYWGGDRLEGYLVLQEYTSAYANHEVLNIVDWEASDPAIQIQLLKAAFATYAKSRKLTIWSATLPAAIVNLLKKRGFQSLSPSKEHEVSPPAILVRPISPRAAERNWTLADRPLLNLANWDLRMLYSMHA